MFLLCEQLHAVFVIHCTFPSFLVHLSEPGPKAADSIEIPQPCQEQEKLVRCPCEDSLVTSTPSDAWSTSELSTQRRAFNHYDVQGHNPNYDQTRILLRTIIFANTLRLANSLRHSMRYSMSCSLACPLQPQKRLP